MILKPSPPDIQELYLNSLKVIGIDPKLHDIRFVEDDWESPTLGAWGLGWECWCDGMEVSQFTYFQQVAGFECSPVSGELTYGLERLAMYVQGVDRVFDLNFNGRSDDKRVTYGDIFSIGTASRTVHPRGCGEHCLVREIAESTFGSSPRVRGTPDAPPIANCVLRFIPAGAGNTYSGAVYIADQTVHPRGCGEHGIRIEVSPQRRFIPAGAGNTGS